MGKIHKIAGLRISRVTPQPDDIEDYAHGRELLPELEPAEARLRRQKSRIFSSDTITLSHDSATEDVFEPSKRAEHHDFVARMTVYVMNATVMVFTMPIGLALLMLNIMGGENLRTTAHVMALTGVFMLLAALENGDKVLPFVV